MFEATIRKVWRLFTGSRKPQSTTRPRVLLTVEPLEHRTLPAVYIWTGFNHATDFNWSDPLNWKIGTSPATAAPGPNDTLQFDSTGVDGTLFDSIDNVGATSQVTSLTVQRGFLDSRYTCSREGIR
jgi:hypothetical protein